MSDVGDAVELTFNAPAGATITVSWQDPAGTFVLNEAPVSENPPGSGLYPVTLLGESAGTWTATFHATGTVTATEVFYQNFTDPTGPPPLATVGEYKELFGPLSMPREAICRALLRRASALVRDRYPDLDAKIAGGTMAANTVALAVLNMTARVMRNPSGLRSETTGPFSRSYDMTAASGLLSFSTDDAMMIDPDDLPGTTGRAGAGKVGTIRVRAGLAPRRLGGWRG